NLKLSLLRSYNATSSRILHGAVDHGLGSRRRPVDPRQKGTAASPISSSLMQDRRPRGSAYRGGLSIGHRRREALDRDARDTRPYSGRNRRAPPPIGLLGWPEAEI